MKHFSIAQVQKQQGMIGLYLTIIVLILLGGIMASIGFGVLVQQRLVRNITQSAQAYVGAEAGVEDAVYRIRSGKQYSPNYEFPISAGTVEVSISGGNTKTITGNYNGGGVYRSVEGVLSLSTVNPQFFYGVQAGEGGVRMDNNSRIEGVGGVAGNFYSNGPVLGDNGAVITGDVIVASGASLAVESTVCNTDQIVGQTNPQIDFAQSFIAPEANQLAKVSLYLRRTASTPGDRTIRIAVDAGGSPADTSIASAQLDADLTTTSYGWIDVVFLTPPTLTANNTYWIVLDAAQSATRYWTWCKDSAGGYANGSATYSEDWDDDPWASATGDLAFQVYLGAGASSLGNMIVYGDVQANTITHSRICGDAYYLYETSVDTISKNFLASPENPTCGGNPLTPGTGFPNQPDPPLSPMPISIANINKWKDDAKVGGTFMGDYTVVDDVNASSGPVEIMGNFTLTNNVVFTVKGTIYVHGNIDINNNVTVQCDPAYASLSCVIVADGWIRVSNNTIFSGSGDPGSYILLLTTLSGCNGISGPTCTDQGSAISINNNATGALFYAANSMILVSNNVSVSEITGYKIQIGNNAIVSYEAGLLDANFSSGPGAGWELTSWKEIP